ncbi:phage portal protein [Wolbachia endosymbiont of Atemnus politus]|uniref:phage portal protein n=1 Tax=Wolbachia endosymbiont of Atemnus politus TaxID=2682840 RepID=UPI00397E5B07
MRQQLRAIAIGMGITYEQLTGDLSGVNYSSIRAGLIEFCRRYGMLQHNILLFQLYRPVWGRWLELAILFGEIGGD